MGLHLINENSMNIIKSERAYMEEIDGVLYIDPLDIALALGYTRPNKALKDFKAKKPHLLENVLAKDDGKELWTTKLIYSFLIKSNMPLAEAWQDYISFEVLPIVEKEAIKEMAAVQGNTPEVFETLDPEGFARKT